MLGPGGRRTFPWLRGRKGRRRPLGRDICLGGRPRRAGESGPASTLGGCSPANAPPRAPPRPLSGPRTGQVQFSSIANVGKKNLSPAAERWPPFGVAFGSAVARAPRSLQRGQLFRALPRPGRRLGETHRRGRQASRAGSARWKGRGLRGRRGASSTWFYRHPVTAGLSGPHPGAVPLLPRSWVGRARRQGKRGSGWGLTVGWNAGGPKKRWWQAARRRPLSLPRNAPWEHPRPTDEATERCGAPAPASSALNFAGLGPSPPVEAERRFILSLLRAPATGPLGRSTRPSKPGPNMPARKDRPNMPGPTGAENPGPGGPANGFLTCPVSGKLDPPAGREGPGPGPRRRPWAARPFAPTRGRLKALHGPGPARADREGPPSPTGPPGPGETAPPAPTGWLLTTPRKPRALLGAPFAGGPGPLRPERPRET